MAKVLVFKQGGGEVTSFGLRCVRFWTRLGSLMTALTTTALTTRGFTLLSLVGDLAYFNSDKEKAQGMVENYSVTGVCLACVAGIGCTCWLSKVDLINWLQIIKIIQAAARLGRRVMTVVWDTLLDFARGTYVVLGSLGEASFINLNCCRKLQNLINPNLYI